MKSEASKPDTLKNGLSGPAQTPILRDINAVGLLSNRYRQLVIFQLLFINQINTGKYMGYQHPLYAREELPGSKAISVRKNSITRYQKSRHGTGK